MNPGGTVTYTHPKFGKIHFDRASVDIRKVPALTAQFTRQLNKAVALDDRGQSAEACMAASQWALRHGLLKQFHMAVDKALAADPNGRFLYVGGYYELAIYAIDPEHGALADTGLSTRPGPDVSAIAIVPAR